MDIAENENKPGLPKYTCSDRVPDKYKLSMFPMRQKNKPLNF